MPVWYPRMDADFKARMFKIKTCDICSFEYSSRICHHLAPNPGFEYYFKACRKADPEAKAIAIGESPVRLLADASEITGLPRDNFESHEISTEEFEAFRSRRNGRK